MSSSSIASRVLAVGIFVIENFNHLVNFQRYFSSPSGLSF